MAKKTRTKKSKKSAIKSSLEHPEKRVLQRDGTPIIDQLPGLREQSLRTAIENIKRMIPTLSKDEDKQRFSQRLMSYSKMLLDIVDSD